MFYSLGMTYYEELGLGQGAGTAEIHKAYRTLVRLLHPDQHAEPALRQLAEAQMRRLNLVHDTLSDPERRQQYDASLAVQRLPLPARNGAGLRRPLGVLAAVCAAGLALWQLLPNRSPASPPPAVEATAVKADHGSGGVRAKSNPAMARRTARTRVRERASLDRLEPASGGPTESFPEPVPETLPTSPVAPVTPLVALTLPPSIPAASPEVAQPAKPTRFTGTWVYVPPRVPPAEREMYSPEYVEAVIQDSGESVRGRYRARYRVPDRPISPDVAFRFEGASRENPVLAAWSGAGGAEGEVKLTLLPSGNLRLEWLATALGTQLGLGSGTAVLVRRQDP